MVLTVSVDVVEPLGTELGLSEHVGAGVPPPVTLQERATLPVKPPVGVMAIVAVADPPAETVAGVKAVAVTVKSGGTGALTVRLIVAL